MKNVSICFLAHTCDLNRSAGADGVYISIASFGDFCSAGTANFIKNFIFWGE
jgi:hypothetical protein